MEETKGYSLKAKIDMILYVSFNLHLIFDFIGNFDAYFIFYVNCLEVSMIKQYRNPIK